ncbi:MAG: HYR domain-containing protein [Acidobacteriota bacterium]
MKLSTTRMLVLTGLVLVVGLLIGWGKQFVPGGTPSVVAAQTKGTQALDAARLALDEARNFERVRQTKEAGVAAQAALDAYNAAVDRRISEINDSLEELRRQAQRNGNTPEIVAQIEALLAELTTLQPSPAGPIPTVTPEVEPNNTSATAQVLISPDNCFIVQGTVSPSADLDFFRVDGVPAGAKAWFYTDTGGALVAGDRDSFVEILAANGTTIIESDDDDGTGNGGDGSVETGFASSIAGRTLTAGGTYFFRVRGFGTFPGTSVVNPYRMFLTITNVAATAEVEANNTAATANPIVTAVQTTGVRSGAIGVSGDVDFYSVVATAGNILFISVDGDPPRTDATTLDGVIQLFAPDGTTGLIVGEVDSGFGFANNSEAFDFNISTTGTYFVRVAGFSTEAGRNYNIMVSACQGAAAQGSCVLTCPANVTQTNDPNQCGAVVTYPAPTSSGSCGTINCSPASGSFFPVGTTTVTCTSSAGPGCTFTVTVQDTQQPSITCPPNQVRSNDLNQCGAVVTYPAPTITDNCPGTFTATCNPPSGSFFPVGTTTVTCTVNGSTAPTPAKPETGAKLVVPDTKASSASAGKVGASASKGGINIGAKPIAWSGVIGKAKSPSLPQGPFAVLYSQIDNPAPSATSSQNFEAANNAFDNEVADDFVVPAGVNWTIDQVFVDGLYFNGPGPATSVNVVFYSDTATLPGAVVATRNNQVIADTAGNFTITLSPTVVLSPGTYWVSVQANQNFTPFGQWGWTDRTTTSNSGSAWRNPGGGFGTVCTGFGRKTTCIPTSGPDAIFQILGTSAPIGGGGGGSTCTFTVTVNDTQPPVITCSCNQTAVTPTPNDPCVVVNFTTTATDNCPGVTVVCNPPSGTCFPVGVTTVTCTATDASGNTATCTFTVSVFNGRLQDDFEACNNTVLFNTLTGDYRWCCHGTIFTGRGKITRAGDTIRLEHIAPDRRVRIDLSAGSFPPSGNAALQSPPGTIRCVIQDRDIRDDTCICGAGACQ